jgi:hypothetical protein
VYKFKVKKPILTTLILLLLSSLAWAYPDGDQRAVTLKGTRNTRELGGLPTADGQIKSGKIFRSGALCFASLDDAAKLHDLGIRTIVELRLPQEIQKDGPDKAYLLEGIPSQIHWPMGNSHGLGREAYVSYVDENEQLFRDFFLLLAEPESYPLLFHCSAGKDRTGILTALLLESLGTPREVIMDDYIHSRRITPKLKVQEDWIQVVFDRIDQSGGIDNYLTEIGVSDAQRQAVKKNLEQK